MLIVGEIYYHMDTLMSPGILIIKAEKEIENRLHYRVLLSTIRNNNYCKNGINNCTQDSPMARGAKPLSGIIQHKLGRFYV